MRHAFPGIVTIDHRFSVPLDHDDPEGETIELFAREVRSPKREGDDLPYLVYLEGGPGLPAHRPMAAASWIKRALDEFAVVLIDPRGTGLSTPVTHETLADRGTPEEQAEYLMHFRADSIVADAEAVRRVLAGEDKPWSALGQSFGGFCLLHYLSVAPESLREALFAGGLPPLSGGPDVVYRALYPQARELTESYYERYPEDRDRVRAIADHLRDHEVTLPSGGRLTPRRFQQLGFYLGFTHGAERLHYLLEKYFLVNGEVAFRFLKEVENALPFEAHPIYAVLHEAIYCQEEASRWSARRVREDFPDFDPHGADPFLFTGEMMYPEMYEDYARLGPLREVASILADHDRWPVLYDADRLAANGVPSAAVIYAEDMFVARSLSEDTAKAVGNMRYWLTNELDHVSLSTQGERVLGRLLDFTRGMA